MFFTASVSLPITSVGFYKDRTNYFLAYSTTFDGTSMNYNSVILVGCFVIAAGWWFVHGIRHYPGPTLMGLYLEGVDIKPDHRTSDEDKSGPHGLVGGM
jgi:hypothetical protein